MQASINCVNLIKEFEGFMSNPYKCPAGKLTIGYGHVLKNTDEFKVLDERHATWLLEKDIEKVETFLNKKSLDLTQGQFDALISLIYNWGGLNFQRSNGFKKLKEGDIEEAKKEFFSREKGVVNIKGEFSEGLYRRRCAELALFEG